jgi:hypothetical protein
MDERSRTIIINTEVSILFIVILILVTGISYFKNLLDAEEIKIEESILSDKLTIDTSEDGAVRKLSKEPFRRTDEHLAVNSVFQDVELCGKTYRTEQIFIDGTDVIPRIAEIVTKDEVPELIKQIPFPATEYKKGTIAKNICDNINNNNNSDQISVTASKSKDPGDNIGLKNETIYLVSIYPESFSISIPSYNIYNNASGGSLIGPIGNLK